MRKERYFTDQSLQTESEQMLQAISKEIGLPDRWRRLPFEPGKSALLILDMQDYFLDERSHAFVPSAAAIIPGLQALIQVYAAAALPVIYTRHINTPQDAGMMSRWWRDLIRSSQPESRITDWLDQSAGLTLEKSQYDAFYGTGLEEHLHGRGVTQVVVCGVMTHLCCETTARSAFMRGFAVYFPVDGTATYQRAFHLAALRNLAHGFAIPIRVADLMAEL